MGRLSKDELDLALRSLKGLQKEKPHDGEISPILAMCYSTGLPNYYTWEQIPKEFVCPTCGKRFGKRLSKENRDLETGRFFEGHGKGVDKWDFDTLLEAYESCKNAGCDVELELHCLDCVTVHNLTPATFRFRLPDKDECAVSFPQLEFDKENSRFNRGESPKRQSGTHFFPWQYLLVASLMNDLASRRNNMRIEEKCREWFDGLTKKRLYEERQWTDVYSAIDGILGLSLGDPPE